MGVTIKDIAQIAGVSHPTVSKALNGAPGVNEETRRRILELAKQLNYVPNAAAKHLANRKSRGIGFIWPQTPGLFFYHLCSTLQQEAISRNINVLVSMSDPQKALHTFREHFIDFTLAWFFPDWTPSAAFIKERDIYSGEMVIAGGGRMDKAYRLLIDRGQGIRDAVEYLSKIGHKKVAYAGERGEKSDGYIRGLLETGLPHHRDRMILVEKPYYSDSTENARELREKFTSLWYGEERPTALIIDSQDTAFGLINCLMEHHISIPDELSVISYDDIPELSIYEAPLTTCGPSIQTIVDAVLDLYERSFAGRTLEDEMREGEQVIKPKLIIRDSVRPLP